jgi:hypothetical protein
MDKSDIDKYKELYKQVIKIILRNIFCFNFTGRNLSFIHNILFGIITSIATIVNKFIDSPPLD